MNLSMESKVLRSADLDYAHRLDDVWESNPYSVEELHAPIRESLLFELEQLGLSSRSRLIRGPGGAGKTHFLGTLRQALSEAAPGTACSEATFILVDMTDVARFWHTVLLGYLESLHKDLRGNSGILQLDSVLEDLFKQISSRGAPLHSKLRSCSTEDFQNLTKEILGGLHKKFRAEVGHYQNVLRAFLALGTENFDLSNVGYTWLLGERLDEEKLALLGISDREQDPREILRGLTWILSLRGNTLLCLDQIDAIVAQGALYSRETPSEQLPEEERKAKGIILNLASGLAALQDQTSRTLVVLSCLEQSFYILRDHALQNLMDRFSESFSLNTVPSGEMAQKIIAQRMAPAFQAQSFTPPYPTWPFAPEAFENIQSLYTPREILQMCQEHRLHCLQEESITELCSFMGTPSKKEEEPEGQDQKQGEKTPAETSETPPSEPPKAPPVPPKFSILDQRFGELEKGVDPTNYLGEDQEDALGELLRLGARLLLWETPLQRNMDIELDPMGSLPSDPLNARIRLIFRSEGDREQHYCFRVIQKNNHNAYRSRLAKALTASGIEKELSFRRLTVFRTLPPVDSGEQTKKQNRAFQKAGGRFAPVTNHEILLLGALKKMFEENDPYFPDWIKKRRLVSQLQCMQTAFPWITRLSPPPRRHDPAPPEEAGEKSPEKPLEREPQGLREEPPRSTSKNATFERTPSPPPEKPREEGIISRVTRWFRKEEESLTITREPLPSPNPEDFLEPPEDAPPASATSHIPEGSERSERRDPEEVSEALNTEQESVKKTLEETSTEEEKLETPEAPPEEPPHPFPGRSSEEPLLFRGVQEEVLLGTEMLLGETITLPPETFARHGVILAGSGAGKTVLMKRLVEEAALCGIPSIVIDSANDLSQMGQSWKEPPSSWGEEMHRKAALFEENVEVLLWTPGHTGGRPLHLSPLPDFEALEDDPSGRDTAITMAVESLAERIFSGNSKNAQKGAGPPHRGPAAPGAQKGEDPGGAYSITAGGPPGDQRRDEGIPQAQPGAWGPSRRRPNLGPPAPSGRGPPLSQGALRGHLRIGGENPDLGDQPLGAPRAGILPALHQHPRHGALLLGETVPPEKRSGAPGALRAGRGSGLYPLGTYQRL